MPGTVTIDVASALTWIGMLVAVLAALYARWSAIAARRQAEAAEAALRETRAQTSLSQAALQAARTQNEISVHGHRLDAYKAMLALRSEVKAKTSEFSPKVIWELWQHAELAEFYFPSQVSQALGSAVSLALDLLLVTQDLKDSEAMPPEERRGQRERRNKLHAQLSDCLERINEEMRATLRLVKGEA